MNRTTVAAAAVSALALVVPLAGPASAATAEEVVGGLVTPLSVAVADDGTVYVAQNFAGLLTEAAPGEDPEVVHAVEGSEVGAVSVGGDTVTFATTALGQTPAAGLWQKVGDAAAVQVADLWAYEKSANPDGKKRYGIMGLSRSCLKKIKPGTRKMVKPYHGIKQSHPYATNVVGDTTYVADAAANAVFAVEAGVVATVAVLPPTRLKITGKVRNALGLPRCTKGKVYKVEGVPTDVELGPDGNLYVTALPGGPEDPSLGANGSVYRVVPGSGAVTKVAGGLVSPVGLAIASDGTAYVSMLFAGLVMKLGLGGQPVPFAEVPAPGDVELHGDHLYVTETNLMGDPAAPPAGKVLRFSTVE